MKKLLYLILFLGFFGLLAQDDPSYPVRKGYFEENIKPNVVFKSSGGYQPFLSLIFPYYVKYLDDPTLRAKNEMQVFDGLIHKTNKVFSNKIYGMGLNIHKSIFVVSQDNRIYFSEKYKPNKFHHSSLVAGEEIKFGGEIVIIDGEILAVNNLSGHYWPEEESYYVLIRELRKMGYTKEMPLLSTKLDITQDPAVIDKLFEKKRCNHHYL